jgi:arsenate reductase
MKEAGPDRGRPLSHKRSLDWKPDDPAGKQSSSAIHDDIDRRVQALLAELVPASI